MIKLSALLICIFFITGIGWSQKPVSLSVADKLSAAGSAEIGGYVGHRLNGSYQNRILAQDINRLVEPFRNRTETSCWQSEFWGK